MNLMRSRVLWLLLSLILLESAWLTMVEAWTASTSAPTCRSTSRVAFSYHRRRLPFTRDQGVLMAASSSLIFDEDIVVTDAATQPAKAIPQDDDDDDDVIITNSNNIDNDDGNDDKADEDTVVGNNVVVTVDESGARSMFGTKEYWDDVYAGRGDFPADCYSWYYGWDVLGKHVKEYLPIDRSSNTKGAKASSSSSSSSQPRILVPGVGNDSLLVDLVRAGYKNLVGQDYSEHAVVRQADLLHQILDKSSSSPSSGDNNANNVVMLQGDVTNLPRHWTGTFDAVIEKGLLDAVYLSGDGNVERAAAELFRVLKPGGLLLSVSGVVPNDLRRALAANVEWLRDGTQDLQAGCFVWRKPTLLSE